MRSSQLNAAQKKMGMDGTTRRFATLTRANPLISLTPVSQKK
jgi:hypothetical protein